MKKNPTIDAVSLESTLSLARDLATRGIRPYMKILEKLDHAKAGSKHHAEMLCELWAAANVIEVKAKEQQLAIDEYLDSLPDDDD